MHTYIYQLGSDNYTLSVYYTPTVEYFGHEHLPYAVLAITLLTLFVLIPLLILLLYPFQFFQKLLSLFPFNWHFLRAFVDSYQGCYKDGTEPGTFDCRWFSTIELLLRPILFIIYGATLSEIFYAYAAILFVIYVILLVNFQPFKVQASRYPSSDIVFFILLSVCTIVLLGTDVMNRDPRSGQYSLIVCFFTVSFALVPVIYIIGLIGFWLVSKIKTIRSRP